MTPAPPDKGELEYGSILPNGEDWRLRKFDAGMEESEYRIFRNERFFAMFDNRGDADIVMVAMTCPTTTPSAEQVLEELQIKVDGEKQRLSDACIQSRKAGYACGIKRTVLITTVERWIAELRQREREQGCHQD
jgi:hypothetical protein